MFELRRCPLFEVSDGMRPARDESWIGSAGEKSGEARAEWSFELRRCRRAAGEKSGEARAEMINELTPVELKARLDERAPVVLLDVRQDWETKLCRLENAVHIPIEEIELRTDELNAADEIVVYCHQGVRSAAVAEYLRSLGFGNVKNLAGGLDAWARSIDPSMRRY